MRSEGQEREDDDDDVSKTRTVSSHDGEFSLSTKEIRKMTCPFVELNQIFEILTQFCEDARHHLDFFCRQRKFSRNKVQILR